MEVFNGVIGLNGELVHSGDFVKLATAFGRVCYI